MFLLKNKNYKSQQLQKAEQFAAQLATYMDSRPITMPYVTFDKIREVADAANIDGLTGADLTDGIIQYLADLAGIEYEQG